MASHPCPNAYSHSRPYLVHDHHRHLEPLLFTPLLRCAMHRRINHIAHARGKMALGW
ncbi:hypothetical protein CGRA01v4_07220 [Colletotrichum graminicola]|nr:hypothetical protein CGRA01v4_07220 [Colletotrichum graminicola]